MGKGEEEIWKEIWSRTPEKEEEAPRRMEIALDLLGRPEALFRSVLVLGQGRRFASRLLCSLLDSYGIGAGLLCPSAPDLEKCIVAKGKPPEAKRLSDLYGELKNFLSLAKARFEDEGLGKMGPLEILMCLSALEFSDEPVDVAVFEVEGGEECETFSALRPEGCIFTPLPPEAPSPLLAELIGQGAFAFSSPQDGDARAALEERAEDAGALVGFDGEQLEVSNDVLAVGGQVADLSTPSGLYPQVPIKLFGSFQAHMALLSLAAGEKLITGGKLDEGIVGEAFSTVKVPGSLRPVAQDPLTLASASSSYFEMGLCLEAVEENFHLSPLTALICSGERFDPSFCPLLAEAADLSVFVPDPLGKGPGKKELSELALQSFPPGRAVVEESFEEGLKKAREAVLASGQAQGGVLCAGGRGAFLAAQKAFRK